LDRVIQFEVDEIKLIKEFSDSQLAIAQVKVCHDGMNKHELPIAFDTMKKAEPTLINKWLVAGWSGNDFKGHEGKEQRIIGFFPKENDFKYIEENGKTYFVANAIISKLYASWAFEVFEKNNFRECSMEIAVLETENKEDGFEWITNYVYNAVTVLGVGVKAACSGASVEITTFSEDQLIQIRDEAYSILDKKEGDKVEFSLNSEQVQEILNNSLSEFKYQCGDYECKKYWVRAYDAEYVYVYNNEADKYERIKYTFVDSVATVDIASAEEVINGGFIPVIQPKEEFTCPDKEKMSAFAETFKEKYSLLSYNAEFMFCYACEEKKFIAIPYSCKEENMEANFECTKKFKFTCAVAEDENDDEAMMALMSIFSADANTAAVAQAALAEKQAEYEKSLNTLHEQVNTLSAKVAEYEAKDNERVEKEKMSIVNCALKDVEESLSVDKIEELRADAVNFSLDNIDQWKNKVFAEGFTSVKNKRPKSNWLRMQFPNNDVQPQKSKSKWDDVKV
jgi:hypothetical protein